MSDDPGPGPATTRRLGYLLKHAGRMMEARSDAALAPLGIDSRELGILIVIADHEAGSQQQAARRLGIDRTSMVARIDALEAKGLLSRRPHAADRRRNLVALTAAGEAVLRDATTATERAEADLLAPLDPAGRARLREALRAVVLADADDGEAARSPVR